MSIAIRQLSVDCATPPTPAHLAFIRVQHQDHPAIQDPQNVPPRARRLGRQQRPHPDCHGQRGLPLAGRGHLRAGGRAQRGCVARRLSCPSGPGGPAGGAVRELRRGPRTGTALPHTRVSRRRSRPHPAYVDHAPDFGRVRRLRRGRERRHGAKRRRRRGCSGDGGGDGDSGVAPGSESASHARDLCSFS